MKIGAIISTGTFFVVVLVMTLYRPVPAFAVSTLTISSSGNGIFLLRGVGIEDAAALDIIVSYDTATLANPRVVEGPLIAGAMKEVNQKIPGIVRMVVIRLTPVKGNGLIATLTFDRTGSSPGRIISLRTRLADIKGTFLPALIQVSNAPEAPVPDSNPSQGQPSLKGTKK